MSLKNKIDYSINPSYNSREERNKFVYSLLEGSTNKSVVNVGSGGERFLQNFAKDFDVFDIDINGDVDLKVNLERDLPLPLKDNQFGLAVCLDVLEHIETFHAVFSEINRITTDRIIISLPNPLHEYMFNIIKGQDYLKEGDDKHRFGRRSKYYGIPLSKPCDRHKWFFSFDEAYDFFEQNADKYGYEVEKVFFPRRDTLLKNIIRRVHFDLYINFVPRAFWIILNKKK
ncbi:MULTISPECIES: methyltransferase domain-containing protein [Thalassospira]|jgi:SAM-dependent methyltransferase|uniref:class I SAM-dependent methyltransferase n=1 Tax=Thalassospira TaxID=168934 RepID=UPI0007A64344|nr:MULTISPECIES: methyltransferase domain-containing protein [unclassified Thalassospira]KZC99053.1 hypothetical protein AUQ41_11030 [Thalassospira sp. MCCC 1A02898]ONH89361.1 hypothetical protein TH47_01565 [Thalassospira sp. MCCC 1A02803]BDW90357.1 hypothetical protein MACH01_31240 [Thalassospira tepidiphila]